MSYKVIYTKFNGNLRDLVTQGNKKVVQAVRAAMAEAGTNGVIQSLPRTKHGESRIKNAEKYDLNEAFRLVVQLVDGNDKVRAFLYVGNHADAERWLDNHKNYKWVKSKTDETLNFIPITVTEERYIPSDRLDLDSPEELLTLPLLRTLTNEEWASIAATKQQEEFAKSVTGTQYEQDADGILQNLDKLGPYEKASLIIDLLHLANLKMWPELHIRAVPKNLELIPNDSNLVEEMISPSNSEAFITFDDEGLLDSIFEKGTFSDWMLFLHPEQEKIAFRDYRGAVRLRGVSGSGKTCVVVHRARYLAKKYKTPILLVTLTESMRKLLDKLADDLCGAERSLIVSKTISMVAKEEFIGLFPNELRSFAGSEIEEEIIEAIAKSQEELKIPGIDTKDYADFLRDEIGYIRGRLLPEKFNVYLDPSAFERKGRGFALGKPQRESILSAVECYLSELDSRQVTDHESTVSKVISTLQSSSDIAGKYRCIICDEVQDFTELDLSLLGALSAPNKENVSSIENGMFLAGDGAQSIYKKGFALRRAGIDVIGRSYSLKKSYRNTYEILKAAFELVSKYEFSDIDEDNIASPSFPEFAKRHGPRPHLIKCSKFQDEAEAISKNIYSLLAMGQTAGQICVIAPTNHLREEIRSALNSLGVPYTELRQDINFDSENVKISTIESAKGHEFSNVYIMGLVEGLLPNKIAIPQEITRDASRLYVAMTRARENLTITYSPSVAHPASRFLLAIQSYCDESHYRQGEYIRIQ